jgi:single-strand DNA-binding protein
MANLNKVMLIGRLTRNPEARTIPSGNKVVAFGFAVNNRRKNTQTGQWEDEPCFIDCEAWNSPREGGRQLGDLIEQYVKKGHQAYLEGHLRLDQWNDKTDGSKRSKLKLIVDNIQFLEPRQDAAGGAASSRSQRPAPQSSPSDIPTDEGGYAEPATASAAGEPQDDIPF